MLSSAGGTLRIENLDNRVIKATCEENLDFRLTRTVPVKYGNLSTFSWVEKHGDTSLAF